MRCSLPKRQPLEFGTHERHFPHLLQIEGSDSDAAPRLTYRQPLRFQFAEGLPYWHVTSAKFLCNAVLTQLCTRFQLAGYNSICQDAANTLSDSVFIRRGHEIIDILLPDACRPRLLSLNANT
jgi:hypothetical protein